MPCSLHFVEGDYSSRSVVGVGLRWILGWAGAMWRVSSSNADRSSLIGWDGVPDLIRGDEGEGSGGIVLGTEVPGVGFKLLLSVNQSGLVDRRQTK